MVRKTVVALTCGDINGIGPEVVIKALMHPEIRQELVPILIGPADVFRYWAQALDWRMPLQPVGDVSEVNPEADQVWVSDPLEEMSPQSGQSELSAEAGRIAAQALDAAIRLALDRAVDAIVTAPLAKQALNRAGYDYPGMTEFLADRTGTKRFAMILIGGRLRIALVTTHCALAKVTANLSTEQILEKIEVIHHDLKRRFGTTRPTIAVCALNPHAGEGGLFGREEVDIITPAVAQARARGIEATGPHSADALFARFREHKYDAYLAMYHDQGLIPIKVLHFGRAVNYTAGLPIIRTSPDHGTAFDIAGKGVANESSMLEAIRLAHRLAQKERHVAG